MAIQGSGLSFYPIFWVYHDGWRNYRIQSGTQSISNHYGHTHLFLMGFDWDNPTQDAWSGTQNYTFSLQDIWGPRSNDPNQQEQYRLVGTPKWYFHHQEIWRRIYIQPWDAEVATTKLLEKRGVRYDACADDKRYGPFREGRDNVAKKDYAALFIRDARTLPIDYYTSEPVSQAARTNHLADQARTVFTAEWPDTNPSYDPSTYNPATYDLQHGALLYAGGNAASLTAHPAAVPPFSDRLYIWPLMEYQKVTQLDWERFPGFEAEHDLNDETFGDGFSLSIEVPFRDPVTGKYRSPFCATNSTVVRPVGEYFNSLVPDDRKARYPTVIYDDPDHPPIDREPYYYDSPAKMPPELSGHLVTWNNPYGAAADGRWVQQCLGGIVQAKAEVTLEHKLGGRKTVWVHATSLQPSTTFAGVDQFAPG